MFILFDAKCPTCQRGFKAEASVSAATVGCRHRSECPRCHTAVIFESGHGTVTGATIGWAIPAAPWSATGTAAAA